MSHGSAVVRVGIAALPLMLGGCAAVPPLVGAVAYAVDGFSLLVSGKTTTDHAVSALAEQDCRLWRLIMFEPACQPFDENAIAIAAIEAEAQPLRPVAENEPVIARQPSPQVALSALVPNPGPAPAARVPSIAQPAKSVALPVAKPPVASDTPTASRVIAAKPAATPAVATVVPAAAAAPAGKVAAKERYLVLGSFRQRENAEVLAKSLIDLGAVITDPAPGVSQFHRVVLGPLNSMTMPAVRQDVAAYGVTGAWQATLCLDANAVEQSCDPVQAAHAPAVATAATPAASLISQVSRPIVPVTWAAPSQRLPVKGTVAYAPTLSLSTDPIY